LALLNSNDIGYKTADQYLPSTKILSDHRSVYQGYYNTQPNVLPVSQSETGGMEIDFSGSMDEDLDDDTFLNFEGVGEEISEAVPNNNMIENSKKHVDHAQCNYLPFQHKNRNAIELLYILRQSAAPLCVYQKIMAWHVNACSRHLPVGNDAVLTQKKVLNELYHHYNIDPNRTIISQQITLSQSRADVNIITYDVEWCIQSLLTDPQIQDFDYLFHADDPFSPPPSNLDYVGDINTGKAYLESYRKFILDPEREVLLPLIFYIDGAATGQFATLPVTPLKFTFGIFNQDARSQPHLWQTLGYVPVVLVDQSLGCHMGILFLRRWHQGKVMLVRSNQCCCKIIMTSYQK
jgi:hypothetical protein